MISMSDVNIEDVLPYFTTKGMDVALLVPTPTGYVKSIMDATTPFREFLLRNKIHDFYTQQQGPNHKVKFPTFFVHENSVEETTASLYRPITKKGDPRVWFSNLKEYCIPCNLLGIVTNGESLFVFNLSNPAIIQSLKYSGTASKILEEIYRMNNSVAEELLNKLKDIHNLGYVKSIINGDTGVGMTLENLLSIAPNASKLPDYKGIEIKASREKLTSPNRVNLFSQVPDWRNSKIKTAQELLNKYGYYREGRLQLYCTVDAGHANPQGLFFFFDEYDDKLYNRSMHDNRYYEVVQWEMEVLRQRLSEKHRETFWVKAEVQIINGTELFQFNSVLYTRKPSINLLGTLIQQNVITMDFTLSQKGDIVRDHGYLFKIKPQNINLLFPEPVFYNL